MQHRRRPLVPEPDVPGIDGDGRGPGLHRRESQAAVPSIPGQPRPGGRHPLTGAGQHDVRLTDIDDRAVAVQGEHEIGERPGVLDVVLDEHERRRALGAQRAQSNEQRRGALRIEVGRGLVEDQAARPGSQHARQGEPLLLAARKAIRSPSFQAGETRRRDRFGHSLVHDRCRPAAVLQPERDLVLDPLHDELAPGVLEDDADLRGERGRNMGRRLDAVHRERALQRRSDLARDETGDGEAERALATPRGPDHEQARAGGDRDGHAGQRRSIGTGIGDGQVAGGELDRWRFRGAQSGKPSRTPA